MPSWGPRRSGSVTAEVGQPVLQRSVGRLAGLGLAVEGARLGTVVEPCQRRVDRASPVVGAASTVVWETDCCDDSPDSSIPAVMRRSP